MAKTKLSARDYKVTYKFGYSKAYGSWHSGEDRPTPLKTPILVNNTLIGYTGSTGYSTGPHIHVTRLGLRGQFTDPKGKGFKLWSPAGNRCKVLATGEDSRSGKWVKIRTTAGRVYVYCHLSKIICKAGDKIK